MKKALAKQIAKHWNDHFAGRTPATRTVAESDGENVWIKPTDENDGMCFHHNEELTDVSRAFKVNSYITTSEKDVITIVIARIF